MAFLIRSMRFRFRPAGEGGNRFLFCFFAGLLAGTAAANLLYPSFHEQAGYYLNLLSHPPGLGKQEQMALFWAICRQRVIEVVIAWLIGLTVYSIPCFCLICGGFGLSVGVVISLMTGQKGIMGLPFFVASVMPQVLFYVPVWCLLLLWGLKRNGRLRFLALFLLLIFVAAGSACEVWLNPWFLGLMG